MPKVSVIVPIYGVEKFIERCVRSLFEQTLSDIEFIFVDDCSPDNSVVILNSIIDSYPERKDQIKILRHETNKGLPIARQTGIKYATGEYIAHCDSDDWVDLDLYESLYIQAKTSELDVVIFGCKITDGAQERIMQSRTPSQIPDCINAMMHRKMWWSLCNKVFKKSIYSNDLIYPKDAMGEDMCLTLQLMYFCKTVGYVNKYYYYYVNPTSIIQQLSEDKILHKFDQIKKNLCKLDNFYNMQIDRDFFKNGLNYLKYNAKSILLPIIKRKEYYKKWRLEYPNCEIRILFDKDVVVKEKIKSIFIILGLYSLLK